MTRFAPSWALTAQALDAFGDPHLQPGIHLRVLPSARIGLPVAPLIVDRVLLGHPERIPASPDVVWTAADGSALTVPFNLAQVGPATAWLPSRPNNPVLFAEVIANVGGFRPPIRENFLWRPFRRFWMKVDAVVGGLLGPAVVASVSRAPYAIAATGMDRLVVSGNATVTGVRVLTASSVKPQLDSKPWRYLELPVERAARYQGMPGAESRAKDRVLRGAPQRFGLADDPSVASPGAAALATPGEELDRVEIVWTQRLQLLLDTVLNDLSAVPDLLFMPKESLAGPTSSTATVQVPPLAGVLQGALDPGLGRMLGLVDRDEAPLGASGQLVAYLVRGAFAVYPEQVGRLGGLLLSGPADSPKQFPLPLPELVLAAKEGTFVDLWTVAVAIIGGPTPPMPTPVVGAGEDLGWLPAVPPEARRHIAVPLAGLVPGASVGFAREAPALVDLNTRLPDLYGAGAPDRAVGLVPGIVIELGDSPAASAPGQGEVFDNDASESAIDYRVAQMDWFGRWSQWAHTSVGPGVRPPVPVPVLQSGYFEASTVGGSGTFRVTCGQPHDNDLAPGSMPLDHLVVTATVGGGGPVVGTVAALRGPAPVPADPLNVDIAVPGLSPAEKRDLIATAHWVDQNGVSSAESPPTKSVAVDPRGPAVLVLPHTLEYAARPDAVGRSRIRLTWPASVGTAFRVYVTEETALRRRLDALAGVGNADAIAARTALAAAISAPDRAAVFHDHAALFDRTCFELLTRAPIVAMSGGNQVFEHEVSGSLGVLVFFKVVPISVLSMSPLPEFGGEADFVTSTLLIRGIPNSPAPPTPTLVAAPDPDNPGLVRLTVTVPAGQTPPVALRLRRSRVTAADALSMPVVATATPTAFPATLVDTGATPWDGGAQFAPWSRYSWRVEVQGAPEPGSVPALPGLWSNASAPATWQAVPPPPSDLVAGTAVQTAAGVLISFASTDALDGGPAGPYLFDVYRRVSAADYKTVGTFNADQARQPDGSYQVTDTSAAVPIGAEYLVEVVDPIGRRSSRSIVATKTA